MSGQMNTWFCEHGWPSVNTGEVTLNLEYLSAMTFDFTEHESQSQVYVRLHDKFYSLDNKVCLKQTSV